MVGGGGIYWGGGKVTKGLTSSNIASRLFQKQQSKETPISPVCVQVCASRLDPDFFVKTVLSRFNVLEYLSFAPADKKKKGVLDPEQEEPMMEGALTLLCQLLTIRTNLGLFYRLG